MLQVNEARQREIPTGIQEAKNKEKESEKRSMNYTLFLNLRY